MRTPIMVLLAAAIGWLAPVYAQQRLVGKVVRAENDEPIAGASVFINNTTYGTSSANNGDFELPAIATGTYEIIVSAVGYHTYAMPIDLSGRQPAFLHIKLEAKQTMLEEVEVVAFEANGWKQWGRLFLEVFIGTSPNADKTLLLNPEVLRFRHYRDEGYLEAIATAPLVIKNRSLGYTVEYVLENFRVDFRNRINQYAGYPHFIEMAGGARSRRVYAKRRKATYQTSLMHFMRSLYQGSLSEDGFEVRRMQRKPNEEKRRVRTLQRTIYKSVWDTTRRMHISVLADPVVYTEDSLAYFREIMAQDDELVTVFPQLLTVDSLLVDSLDGRKKMVFEDYLHVQNTRLKEEPGYLRHFNEVRKPGPQTSMLLLYDNPYIWIERNGSYFPPQSLYTGWYWAWCDKIADLLPLDYNPPTVD
ncbi:carboxypeptidase-like regulatory domain-containing protein [Parapedobacter luteus]|nr:carboxypeptidase-like regulatory domain-containing protein [Parapedobacter luteus]